MRTLLLLHSIISSGKGDNGWSTTLPLGAWARALSTTETAEQRSATTAASKILGRLEDRRLIRRARSGHARKVTITLLRPDGSGVDYSRPGDGNKDPFFSLHRRYWDDAWWSKLSLPATAMLLVALHERPGFTLPTEHVPQWYGWSADTAERGFRQLQRHGLLDIDARLKTAPLSPTGQTKENVYTLTNAFGRTRPGSKARGAGQ
ncbi:MAG: hypothetical protein L0G99_05105 [Propionibacteriales bacterium]|nr:hypothetical protein [Propionibacteriales bacterium]